MGGGDTNEHLKLAKTRNFMSYVFYHNKNLKGYVVEKNRPSLGEINKDCAQLGEGNGTHSSALAWRIPGTAEPGGPQSMGLHRVGHD